MSTCQKQKKWYTQQSPEIETYNPVNNPYTMKQKIVTELGLLDIEKIISDMEELQLRIESTSKNMDSDVQF